MDVEKLFHMTGGLGQTSYAKNSSLQKKASDMVKHITMEAIQELCGDINAKSIGIADLGCSSGPNTLSIIKDIIEGIEGSCDGGVRPLPEFRVYLNDLPTNDFNSIFKALPDFYRQLREDKNGGCPSVFIAAYPGSFYGRIFPNTCIHFVYSSYSLHWLSRNLDTLVGGLYIESLTMGFNFLADKFIPTKQARSCNCDDVNHKIKQVPLGLYDEQGKSINKGNIYISESSPKEVSLAYFNQFQQDFSMFLRSRSGELVAGGRMVLILLGRSGRDHVDRGNSFFWELLARSFAILVSKGEIEKEKVESYEVHFYAPSSNEIEEEVRREGSFEVDRLEMFEFGRDDDKNGISYGVSVAMTVRAIQESMISHHFGEAILDNLFDIYASLVDEESAKQQIKPITLVSVLRKL